MDSSLPFSYEGEEPAELRWRIVFCRWFGTIGRGAEELLRFLLYSEGNVCVGNTSEEAKAHGKLLPLIERVRSSFAFDGYKCGSALRTCWNMVDEEGNERRRVFVDVVVNDCRLEVLIGLTFKTIENVANSPGAFALRARGKWRG